MSSNNKKIKISRSFLFKLTCRTSIFFLLFSVSIISIYITGSYQNFLDSTQFFLLFLCSLNSVILLLFSAAGFIESVALFFINWQKRYILYSVLFLILSILCFIFLITFSSISIIAKGINYDLS